MLDLGFGSTKEIVVNGIAITPRDFAVKYIQENLELLAVDEPFGFGGLKVIVKGLKDGKPLTYMYTTVSSETTGESTSIPAAIGAELIAQGKINTRGVIAPELLDPMQVFSALGKRKRLNNDSVSSGLMIERINEAGSREVIKLGNQIKR